MTNEGVKYQLRGIEILDINLSYPKNLKTKETKFRFDFTSENKVNLGKGIILVVPKVSILNDESNEMLGSIRINFAYEVENLHKYVNDDDKTIVLPKEFQLAINAVAISTTRGIMYSQFRGTFLQNAILPVIDPNILTQKNS